MRRLDLGMIADVHDVVEKKILEMSTRLEASLTDQVKEGIVEFHKDLWSWSLSIQKRVVWLVKKIVQRRRHFVIKEEVKDDFTKAEEDSCFHDQLNGSDMQIAEHLIMDDEIVDRENSHMDVSNNVQLDVAGVDSLVANVAKDLHVALIVDLGLHVADLALKLHDLVGMNFMLEDIVVVGCDQLQGLLVKHYV